MKIKPIKEWKPQTADDILHQMMSVEKNKLKCDNCGEYSSNINKVLRRSGMRNYCKKKECQQAFHDDAGDPPDEYFD